MNVCNLELSKQLYEVSGWEGELSLRYLTPFDDEYAVYTLGYLLRKLPRTLYDNKVVLTIEPATEKTWNAVYSQVAEDARQFGFEADTPEDAACKLAIALFHQGILKRKGEE